MNIISLESYKEKISQMTFEPLKITFKMQSPIIIDDYPIMLDGILTRAVALNLKGIDALDTSVRDFVDIPLPLKKSGKKYKYYHASIMFYNDENSSKTNDFYIKRWESQMDYLVKSKDMNNIDISRGYFKAVKNRLSYLSCQSVYFYAYGNKEEISRLLKSYISHIGKKSSQGYGKISSFAIEIIKKDISVVNNNNEVNRPIPISEQPSNIKNPYKKVMAYKPSYFDLKNYTLCFCPDPTLWGIK